MGIRLFVKEIASNVAVMKNLFDHIRNVGISGPVRASREHMALQILEVLARW